ncbi:PD40 domain-containing protein [bacterium]|nr:PD40 domain-containing protein [bacterium]
MSSDFRCFLLFVCLISLSSCEKGLIPSTPGVDTVYTVAFESSASGDMNIYTVSSTGDEIRQITNSPYNDISPRFSPDGQRVVYLSNYDVFICNTDGTGRVQLTDTPDTECGCVFSPDGNSIAFSRDEGGNENIFVMDIASGEERRLTTASCRDFRPLFTPDGETIIFLSDRDSRGIYTLYSCNLLTGEVRRLNHSLYPQLEPNISPSGDMIAFKKVFGVDSDIYYLSYPGLTEHLLFDDAGQAGNPVFSTDGSTIAFTREIDYTDKIYILDIATGDTTRISDIGEGINYASPCWSPDGTELVYASDKSGQWKIYRFILETGEEILLTDIAAPATNPVVSPD